MVGGVMSSVGKGITTASVAKLLQTHGYNVTCLKADPYINVDAGTMNPTEHGEVFVTEDADECDQDIGNYERFLDTELTKTNYMTTGRVYQTVIAKERNLEYGGKCVEVVPHIPQEIIKRIKKAGQKTKADFIITEIGGTVGEYQNILFLEAARMLKTENPEDVQFILVSYLPIPSKVGEMKTKPTQYASRTLNSAGIQADFIVARSEKPLDNKRKEKLATFCAIPKGHAISAPDVDSIYEVPLMFDKEKLSEKILEGFNLKSKKKDLKEWKALVRKIKTVKKELNIAVVGKYFGSGKFTLSDSYVSVIEAVKHACWKNNVKPVLTWIDSEEYEKNPRKVKELDEYDGIIVPGGFGTRGVEGIIKAIKYARENKIPYFGLCYGMQLATVEISRSLLGLKKANTVEINEKTPDPVICVNPNQEKNIEEGKLGGTLRLGGYKCKLDKESLSYKAYQKPTISERHRHRFEFNNKYKTRLEKAGVRFAGINPEQDLVEIIEFKDHPWFVGVQFHPEFKSSPLKPHPLFMDFVKASIKNRK